MTSQILLFSQPRSGCHLIERMLDGQSRSEPFWRPFEPAWRFQLVEWLRNGTYSDGMPADKQLAFEEVLQHGVHEWKELLQQSQDKDKIFMLHTHSFFPIKPQTVLEVLTDPELGQCNTANFALVPDELLLRPGTVPILTIRHPRLVVPSAFPAMQTVIQTTDRANLFVVTNPVWCRLWYNYYMVNGIEPLIIDADDYMTSEDFVRHLCSVAGLNADEAVLSWSESTSTQKEAEKLTKEHATVQTTLINSAGMKPGRAARNLDLDAEDVKWKEQFGKDWSVVEDLIRLAMPHYEYLHERRLQL